MVNHRLGPGLVILTCLVVAGGCGQSEESSVGATVRTPPDVSAIPVDSRTSDEPETSDVVMRILKAAVCPDDVIVEREPIDSVVASLEGWAQVIETGPGVTAPDYGSPIEADGMTAGVQLRWGNGETEQIPVRVTYAWTKDLQAAIADSETEVWVGLQRGEPVWEAPFVLAMNAGGFAFSGICADAVTDQMKSVFGEDVMTDLRQMMTMNGTESAAFMATAWAEQSTVTPPPSSWDLPQYIPGMSEIPGVADVATAHRRVILNLSRPPADPEAVVCAATTDYVGDCASLDSYAVDQEGNLVIDVGVFVVPGGEVRLVYLPSNESYEFQPLAELGAAAPEDGSDRVAIDNSVAGVLTASRATIDP